jgi:hypothetical protein
MQRLEALLPAFVLGLAVASSMLPSGPGLAVQAIVLPQLSVECWVAIAVAYSACTQPGLQGTVGCGLGLVQMFESCP